MAEELTRWCFPMLMTKHAWLSSYLIPFCLKNFFTSSNDTDPKLRESKEWKWRLSCAHRLWSLEHFNTVAWQLRSSLKCPSKMNDRKYIVKRVTSLTFLLLKKVCVSDPKPASHFNWIWQICKQCQLVQSAAEKGSLPRIAPPSGHFCTERKFCIVSRQFVWISYVTRSNYL